MRYLISENERRTASPAARALNLGFSSRTFQSSARGSEPHAPSIETAEIKLKRARRGFTNSLAIISLKCLRSIKKIAEISYRTGASSAVSQSPQFCFGLCVTENKQRPEFIFCIRHKNSNK